MKWAKKKNLKKKRKLESMTRVKDSYYLSIVEEKKKNETNRKKKKTISREPSNGKGEYRAERKIQPFEKIEELLSSMQEKCSPQIHFIL
jgi:hypothetical protein